ncbi:MAG: bifunctional hydroxymethylpyrimidine kinase/phosphomethylpyrimidine kinase [Alphaproteobacteria bacterium]
MQPSNSRATRPPIIVLSSLVADGSVGGRLACFALERLGFPVWFVPTATLPRHPGRSPSVRTNTSAEFLQGCLADLSELANSQPIAAVLTGYMGDAQQIDIIAGAISNLKATHPDLLYLCDPVLGDGEQLYVTEETANAMRDKLWPLCDIATPNSFELCWLEGAVDQSVTTAPALADLSRTAAPQRIAVTSVAGLMKGHIGNLLATPDTPAILFEHLAMPHAPHGTGDLFAALLLGHYLLSGNWEKATERASAALFELTARAAKSGLHDLPLVAEQMSLERPMASVSKRQITTAQTGSKTGQQAGKKGKRPVLKPSPLS